MAQVAWMVACSQSGLVLTPCYTCSVNKELYPNYLCLKKNHGILKADSVQFRESYIELLRCVFSAFFGGNSVIK